MSAEKFASKNDGFYRRVMLWLWGLTTAGVAMLLTTSWLLKEFGATARFLRGLPAETVISPTTWIVVTIASGLAGFGIGAIFYWVHRCYSRY